MIEDTEIIAINTHENVLRIHTRSETLQDAIYWLRNILKVKKHTVSPGYSLRKSI
jgi:hypothetical protein